MKLDFLTYGIEERKKPATAHFARERNPSVFWGGDPKCHVDVVIGKKDLAELIREDGTLSLPLTINISTDGEEVIEKAGEVMANRWMTGLTDATFLASFADFVLVGADGGEVACLKAILALKSPVFRSMFETGTCREVKEGKATLKDFNSRALGAFWRFILSEDIDSAVNDQVKEDRPQTNGRKSAKGAHKSDENDAMKLWLDLLRLGDKYDVKGLKLQAGYLLAKSVKVSNVLKIIKVADEAKAEKLVEMSLDFIVQNRSCGDLKGRKFHANKERGIRTVE